jgi:hypothetical protein
MKKFLLTIILCLTLIPAFSLAQVPLGTCTLPALSSQGATAPGYAEDQCYADGGTNWVADSPNNAVPINTGNPAPNTNNNTNTNSTTNTDTSSDGGLVKCGKGSSPSCNFTDFMTLVNTVIQFLLFKMAVPIAAIMFAYAGFTMVISGGSPEAKTKAKTIFTNVALGLIIAVAAWLIIRTILLILDYEGGWIGF